MNNITLLNTLAPIIFPHIPSHVEAAYKKLISFDITKQYFLSRNDRFKNFSSNKQTDINVISAQADFLKDLFSMYLKKS